MSAHLAAKGPVAQDLVAQGPVVQGPVAEGLAAEGLAAEGLGVTLGGRRVVADVSVSLAGSTFVALVGPNGAGKTSLLRALIGLVPYAGRVVFAGRDLAGFAPRERARTIAYLPQGHEAHWPLPARDVVALGRLPHGAGDPARLSIADRQAVEAAMRLTGTEPLADREITRLSGGERARIALARVFAVEAPVILADEPTAALDPRHQLDVMAALRACADRGVLVIAVTHDLGLAARFADTVLVMEAGRLVTAASPVEALATGYLEKVFGVTAFRAEHEGRPVLLPWA